MPSDGIIYTFWKLRGNSQTLMSSTTCFQNTSNNWTSSGTPRNFRTVRPSLLLPFADPSPNEESVSVSVTEDFSVSVEIVCATEGGGDPQALASDVVGEAGSGGRKLPFSRERAFCIFTFSARRRAAASS